MNINDIVNKIHSGDCVETMKKMPDGCVDLVFADPPYNLQLGGDLHRPDDSKVDAVNDAWDYFSSNEEYDKFTTAWLTECKRLLKDDGTIWVIGSYHNIFRVGRILQDLGFHILNDILWVKSNPMPNFKGTRFNNAHETLIWAAKSKKSKYTFHYKSMKVANEDKQMRSDWYIPICSGEERLKDDAGNKAHSTQKPEALLYRVLVSSSNVEDVVLDPFCGSGTTAAVAKKLNRKYITIEKEQKYIDVAQKRIDNIKVIDAENLTYEIDEKPPKVPFGNLIEAELVKAGEFLYSKDKKYKAKVLANSSLKYGKVVGSIHKVSAKILKKETNNGWDYWFVERNSKLIPINDFRYKLSK